MRYHGIVFIVALLNGCAYIDISARQQRLDDILWGYTKAMTWSDLATAHSATRAAQAGAIPFPDIKVTAYEPTTQRIEENGKTLKRIVQIRYVHNTRMVEHTLNVEEVWKYSDESKRWLLESGFPSFKY